MLARHQNLPIFRFPSRWSIAVSWSCHRQPHRVHCDKPPRKHTQYRPGRAQTERWVCSLQPSISSGKQLTLTTIYIVLCIRCLFTPSQKCRYHRLRSAHFARYGPSHIAPPPYRPAYQALPQNYYPLSPNFFPHSQAGFFSPNLLRSPPPRYKQVSGPVKEERQGRVERPMRMERTVEASSGSGFYSDPRVRRGVRFGPSGI